VYFVVDVVASGCGVVGSDSGDGAVVFDALVVVDVVFGVVADVFHECFMDLSG
jgi:hypothetical protein